MGPVCENALYALADFWKLDIFFVLLATPALGWGMMANMETLTAMDALAYANINVTGRDEIISILRQHAQGMKMYVLASIVAFCTSLDALLVRL